MVYPTATNLTTLPSLFGYTNSIVLGDLGIGFIFALYVIVVVNLLLREREVPDAFIVAGWICSISSVFLFFFGIMNNIQLFIVIALLVIAMIWGYLSKERE